MELRSIAVAAALLACGTAGAAAQDIGFDWTGGYVGGSLAYTTSNSNAAFVPTSPYASVPIKSLPKGFSGAIQGGINQQMGNIVLGVEGDISVGSISTTMPDPLIAFSGGAMKSSSTVTATSDIQASLRGRFGVAIGNFLPYATAGVALAHLKTSATNSLNPPLVGSPLADEGIGYGWTVGLGAEYAIDENWSVRGQYLHTDITAPNFYVGENYENSAHPVSDTFALGVNYRFN
jgi:outer membrane immunogenic protein